jgi:hypothetical protein
MAYELHCTVEEIGLNLQQTTLANQILLNQVSIHVNELLESISRLENETRETEILLNELNNTVETTREHVRLEERAADKARQHFSDVVDSLREFSHRKPHLVDDHDSNSIFRRHHARNRFPHRIGRKPVAWCHFDVRDKPAYQSSAKAMHEAFDKLKNRQQQLEDEIVKQNATQSQLRNSSQQLMELNKTLQQQQIIKSMTDALNKHLQLITNRLNKVSNSSKRLIDVLMYALDYETIVKPLNSIDEKLFGENMIESNDFKLSKEIMEKMRQKLMLLTAKLPQLRYRRKEFHQPCIYQ